MGTEASVKRLDSTGGRDVRTLEVTTYINGSATTVEMQVVAIADEQGRPLTLVGQKEAMDVLYTEARAQTEILLRILNGIDHKKVTRAEIIELMQENEPEQETNP